MTTGVGDALRLQFFEQREAVFARHDDVRKDQVERLRGGQFQCLRRVVADRRLMAFQAKGARK